MDQQERAAGRNRVMLAAQLLTRAGEKSVRVRDLSGRGAKLVAPPATPQEPVTEQGADVIFCHRDMFAAAKVQWVRDGEIGIEFYTSQTPQTDPAG